MTPNPVLGGSGSFDPCLMNQTTPSFPGNSTHSWGWRERLANPEPPEFATGHRPLPASPSSRASVYLMPAQPAAEGIHGLHKVA